MKAAQPVWDRWGRWAAIACLVHCAATPLLVLGLPAVASTWEHPLSHALMALVALPLALFSAIRCSRTPATLGLVILGTCALLTGAVLPFGQNASAAAPVELNGQVPGLVPSSATATSTESACDGCCPTVTTDAAGATRLKFPPASILTIAGSCLLLGVHRRRQPRSETCCAPSTDAATCDAAPTLPASGTAR